MALVPLAKPIAPVPADDFVMSISFLLLVVLVLVLVGFVIWLGRRLMLQMLATRQVAESHRLARREGQHQEALKQERRRWFQRGKESGPLPIPGARRAEPLDEERQVIVPPPLPPVALGITGVGEVGTPPDWSDSRPLTELDLRPDPELAESGQLPIGGRTDTMPIPLVPERAPTVVWPHRKLPRRED